MSNQPVESNEPRILMQSAILVAVIWTLLVGGSLYWNLTSRHQETLAMANLEAMSNLNKDISFRSWVASHGGVYVPVTAKTPPNPYLTQIKERDVTTTDGRRLTLMNPAYVIHQLLELHSARFGIRGKITSLKLLNPENAPDAWETKALKIFESGGRKFSEVQTLDGKPVLRTMIALVADQDCLKCHAEQGYKVGDVRGGLGTTISLEPYLNSERNDSRIIIITHSIIWLLVCLAILVVTKMMQQRARERMRAVLELKNSQMLFKTVTDHATEWVFWRNLDNSLRYVSPVCEKICGYSAAELIAQPSLITEMVHPEDREHWELHRHAADADMQPEPLEYRILTKQGQLRWISHACRAVYDEDGKFIGVRGSNADVTDRHQKDELLIMQSRHVAMGEMLNNIAHQWRQPLTVLGLTFQNMRLDSMEGVLNEPTMEKYVSGALNVVNSMSRTIDDFRNFFRSDGEIVDFDLQEAVAQGISVISASLQHHNIIIHISQTCPGDGCHIRARGYPNQFSQVLLNLLTNAKDIMIERGIVAGSISIACQCDGDMVTVTVSDNGGGIPDKLLPKIFDPYFTTKVSGTGLGLFMSKVIMENMGGGITARNSQDGAELTLTIPAAKNEDAL